LNQALDYLDMGWSVIPLRGKRPVLGSWLEYQKRLATREEVREWFRLEPDANIGIVTGKVSGLVVVDFDGITVSLGPGFTSTTSRSRRGPRRPARERTCITRTQAGLSRTVSGSAR
jgi:hypothetical protein